MKLEPLAILYIALVTYAIFGLSTVFWAQRLYDTWRTRAFVDRAKLLFWYACVFSGLATIFIYATSL